MISSRILAMACSSVSLSYLALSMIRQMRSSCAVSKSPYLLLPCDLGRLLHQVIGVQAGF